MAQERLELVISTKGGRTVERQFDAIGKGAQRAGDQATRMGDRVDRAGARGERSMRRYRDEMRRTGNAATNLAGRAASMNRAFTIPSAAAASMRNMQRGLRGLAGAFAGFYAGRYLLQAYDDGVKLENTLRGFGVSVGSVDRVSTALTKMANAARVSSREAATLFGRLRLATKGMGLTEDELLSMTGTLNKALRLSGSSGLEASQSIRQLSQAFNKGKLDGDEFRSVLENAPILTKLLTDELRISKTELYDWAAAGKISTRILTRAVQNGAKDIDREFAKIQPTLGDAFIEFYNNLVNFIRTTPAAGSAAAQLANAIKFLGENLDLVLGVIKVYAAGFLLGKVIELFTRLKVAVEGATAAYVAFNAAQAASGVARGAGAVGAAGAAGAGRATTAAAAAGAQAGFPAPLGGPVAAATVATVATESKKVQSIWKRIGSVAVRPFSALRGIFGYLLQAVRFMLTPWGAILAIVTTLTAYFTGGFLKGLKGSTGEVSKMGGLLKTMKATFGLIGRYINLLFGTIAKKFEGVGTSLSKFIMKAINYTIAGIRAALFAGLVGIQELVHAALVAPLELALNMLLKFIDFAKKRPLLFPGLAEHIDGAREAVRSLQHEVETFGATVRSPAEAMFGIKQGRAENMLQYVTRGIKEIFEKASSSTENALSEFFGGAGEAFGHWTSEVLKGQMAIMDYQETVKSDLNPALDELKSKLQDAGKQFNFVDDAKLKEQIAQIDQLKERFDPKKLDAVALSETGAQGVEDARAASIKIAEYIRTVTDALDAFKVSAEAAGADRDALKKAVNDLETTFKEGAEKLPPEFREAATEAANQLISEMTPLIDTGFTTLGTNARTAFLNGLGLGGILSALRPTAVGAGPGEPAYDEDVELPTLGSGFTFPDIVPEINEAIDANNRLGDSFQRGAQKLQEFAAQGPEAFKKIGSGAQSTANEIQNFFESAFGTLEDALVEFVTTGEFDFKKFINAIIADLARLVIRMLIIKPLMNFFGGLFGFGFAHGGLVPGAFGTPGGTIKKLATGSGVIGGYGGTTSDRYLAAVSPGEFVVNASATRRNYADLLRMNNGGTARGKQKAAGGQTTINYAPQITVVNEGGGAGDGQQQGEQIGTMVRQSFTELLMRETRPGGMLESLNRREFL